MNDVKDAPDVGARSGERGMTAGTGYGQLAARISNRVVALHKEFYGKGPTKARTVIHDEVVVCILQGGFTRIEKTLQETGHEHVVKQQRAAFQEVMRERFTRAIEELLGRRVVGFMSGAQTAPEMMAEVFVLETDEHRNR